MFSRDVGIDLGTANVLIYVKGRGIVLDQPSVVAVDSNTNRVLEVGEAAREMVGRTPGNIVVTRPLKNGVIANFEKTEVMLKYFLDKINVKGVVGKPRVLICTPTNITTVEQKAIREAVQKSGGKQVFIEEEPKVAAIGAGMDIFQPSGNMVVDIGGGTTDVAVLSMGDIVTASSIKIAGDKFDQAILQHIKRSYKLLIGERSAEYIKVKVATVFPGARDEEVDVRGRDMVSGLPRNITVHSSEIEEILRELIHSIVRTAKSVLEKTPPELSADIIDRGVILTGGGALLNGIDRLFAEELKVPAYVADDPLTCVARGTGLMLEYMDNLPKQMLL